MSKREFDEVWDPDLLKQQVGELRRETARLKQELAQVKKRQEKSGQATAELRRLVQDGHLRERHLRSRYHELLQSQADAPPALGDGGGADPAAASERVDPALVNRVPDEAPENEAWPTPEAILPSLSAHPGWGNYASMGEDGVVIGISLLGLDHNGRKDVIALVSAQQLRNPELFPIFITDDDDFRELRAEHFVFEYLPPWPGEAVVPSRERWEAFLLERLTLIKRKWGVRRFVSFGAAGLAPRDVLGRGEGTDAEAVQRELADAAKD